MSIALGGGIYGVGFKVNKFMDHGFEVKGLGFRV